MSFIVTVYRNNNPEIFCTDVTAIYNGVKVTSTAYYEQDSAQYAVEPDGGDVIFEAFPANGCSFTRWVYRIGSTTADVHHSTRNPFTYSGGEDIYIRAEGEEDSSSGELPDEWMVTHLNGGSLIENNKSIDLTLKKSYLQCIEFSCKYAGTIKIYSEGDTDTRGFLTKSTSFDSTDGIPKNILIENDDIEEKEYNFSFQYTIKAEETYYLWVRGYDELTYGDTTIFIVPPTESGGGTVTGGSGVYILVSKGTADNPYLEWVEATPTILISKGTIDNPYLDWC